VTPSDPRTAPTARAAVLAALVCLLFSRLLGFAEAGATDNAIQGEERVRVLDRMRDQQREVAALRATIVQKRHHPLLRGEVLSEGTFLFKRPNQLRWEVDKPERTIIVMDGYMLLIYHPDRNEAERRDLRQDVISRAAVDFLISGISLDVTELEKRFQVDLYRESGRLALKLTPRSRLAAQAIASVTIYQGENEAIPRQIVLVGQKGDRTETILTHVSINPRIPEDTFTLRLGPKVKVTEVGKPPSEGGSDR